MQSLRTVPSAPSSRLAAAAGAGRRDGGADRDDLGVRDDPRRVAAVVPRVTVATLPLHLRHHLVRRLVPGPHEGTVARDTQTGSHMRIQWPTESTALLLLIG